MNIGIDARFYGTKNKGLGRYIQKLIENLEKIDNNNQYFIFLKKDNFDDYQPKNKNFKKVLANYKWYGIAEQIFIPLKIIKLHIDLMHFPHFNVPLFVPKKFIITIHDLIPFYFPSKAATQLNPLIYKIKYLCYKLVISAALKNSKKIIAVSNFTKKDILKNFPKINPEKIEVIYEGADFYQKTNNYNFQYNNYILYVGNAYPHKNLLTLITAFIKVNEKFKNLKLLIVGVNDYFFEKIKKTINFQKNIIFINNPSDKELIAIYKNASILIMPSLYEGFGLPLIEAMYLGIPTIASNIEIFHEICGKATEFFDPNNPNSLKEKIELILENPEKRNVLIKNGLIQAEKYQWKKTAEKILKIYNSNTTNCIRI